MKFEAEIYKGKLKLIPAHEVLLLTYIRKFKPVYIDGKEVPIKMFVDVNKPKIKRSINHNSYYWAAVATPIADMIGQHKLVFHEQIKCHLFGFKEVGGLRIPNKDTHDMNKEDFQIFVEDVKLWAFEFLEMTFEPEG